MSLSRTNSKPSPHLPRWCVGFSGCSESSGKATRGSLQQVNNTSSKLQRSSAVIFLNKIRLDKLNTIRLVTQDPEIVPSGPGSAELTGMFDRWQSANKKNQPTLPAVCKPSPAIQFPSLPKCYMICVGTFPVRHVPLPGHCLQVQGTEGDPQRLHIWTLLAGQTEEYERDLTRRDRNIPNGQPVRHGGFGLHGNRWCQLLLKGVGRAQSG